MREVPPGPEWESMRHQAEDDVERLNEQLLAGPPFPVYAALGPPLGDDVLAGAQTSNGELQAVELVCGDVLRLRHGQMLMVRSARLGVDEDKGGFLEPDLEDALAEEWERREENIDAEVPRPGRVEESATRLVVDGAPRTAQVRREGQLWAARLRVPYDESEHGPGSVLVTVIGWDVPLEQVRVRRVDDLTPYVRARADMMASAVEQLPRLLPPESWQLPPAPGMEGHVALIESSIAETRAWRGAAEGARRYRTTRAHEAEEARLWETAVRSQMRLAGQSRDEAEEAVTSLVNHMVQLSETAPWFSDPELHRDVIDESVRYVVFDSDVPSRPAQQAWQRSWAVQSSPPNFGLPPERTAMQATFSTLMQRQDELLMAWTQWLNQRADS